LITVQTTKLVPKIYRSNRN